MLMLAPISSSIMFSSYGQAVFWLQSHAEDPKQRLSPGAFFLAGSFAGCVAVTSYCTQFPFAGVLLLISRLSPAATRSARARQGPSSAAKDREGQHFLHGVLGLFVSNFQSRGCAWFLSWCRGYVTVRIFVLALQGCPC